MKINEKHFFDIFRNNLVFSFKLIIYQHSIIHNAVHNGDSFNMMYLYKRSVRFLNAGR